MLLKEVAEEYSLQLFWHQLNDWRRLWKISIQDSIRTSWIPYQKLYLLSNLLNLKLLHIPTQN